MSTEVGVGQCRWLSTGWQVFPKMLSAIETAEKSVELETYIFSSGKLAERFRDALVRACSRGLRVRVLIDALGSMNLPSTYLAGVTQAGGQVRYFNPLALDRLGIRNHRKLLVCDGREAFVGGYNIADEYDGDGVTRGWCDVGVRLEGRLVPQLADSFDEMFARADFLHKRFPRLRKTFAKRKYGVPGETLLLGGPGRGPSPIRQALTRDLQRASKVQVMSGYFLPTWRIRHQLTAVARRGGQVELILAGKSDVALAQLAGQSLYRRFFKPGIYIYEYQPQVLHAKLLIVDDFVYVGSANLDHRSLNINYELMVRLEEKDMVREARTIFSQARAHCTRIVPETWRRSRSFWTRLKGRWAYFILARLDPYIATKQWMALPD